jgi:hypothetical protein
MAEELPPAALALRVVHAAISLAMLLAIAEVWRSALTGREGAVPPRRPGRPGLEGLLVAVNRGDCPLGGLQRRLGDPVPLFELAMTPRVAKLAVPTLGAVAGAGLAVLAWRSRRATG